MASGAIRVPFNPVTAGKVCGFVRMRFEDNSIFRVCRMVERPSHSMQKYRECGMVLPEVREYHQSMNVVSTRGDTLAVSTRGKERIALWLVEDNDQYKKAITRLINASEEIVCDRSFARCEEFLEALDEGSAPEVVLMDIGLPGMDGITGIQRLKGISPATEAIVLTVHDDNDKVFQAICAGASGYLLKDAPADAILQAIREVLEGGAPMSGQIARRVLAMFGNLAVPQSNYGLTSREKEILRQLVEGHTKKEIANILFLSPYTIGTHLKNIYAKLHVHTRSGAVGKVLKERLI
jgi:DNA-binding NarL/FixJ family response regulator